jgi:hypothetical protein
VDQGTVFDDDVKVIGTRMDTKKYNKDITSTRKRGHPRKNVERSNTDTQKESAETAQNIDKQVQGKRCRVPNPSQYNRFPYRQKLTVVKEHVSYYFAMFIDS